MSVAESFKNYPIEEGPYERDKKQYVKIKFPCCKKHTCPRCGGTQYYLKEVRWYDEPISFNARIGFGFYDADFITLLKGEKEVLDNFFYDKNGTEGRYNSLFSWYLPSNCILSSPLPEGVETIKLTWEEISEGNILKNYADITAYVNSLVTGTPLVESTSIYIGSIGDRFQKDFLVVDEESEVSHFGENSIYTLQDYEENYYRWKTAARKLSVGDYYTLKGTIKEHTLINGTKCTIITNCRKVEN